jgi:hypothetical protein
MIATTFQPTGVRRVFSYFLLWFPMIPIAFFNALLREKVYGPHLSEMAAHQLSTVTAVLFFGLYTWGVTARWPLSDSVEALAVGGMWLVLTVAFEFGFGRYVAGHSWKKLLSDYNLLRGRVWSLLLVAIFLLPWICFTLRNG